jgi:hypothetical protein
MKFFDLKIRISSNYQTEKEVMEKFGEWLAATKGIKTSLWQGNSCIVELGVTQLSEKNASIGANHEN